MPRVCTACHHPQRADIDRALIAGTDPLRAIAARHGLSVGAIRRHRESHLPATMAMAHEAAEQARAGDLMAMLARMEQEAWAVLEEAKTFDAAELVQQVADAGGKVKVSHSPAALLNVRLAAVSRLTDLAELRARAEGELPDPGDGVVTVVFDDDWRTGGN